MMNKIIVINRPATSGLNFSCLQAPQFDQINMIGKEGKDKDWDRDRYRRKQAHQAIKMLLTVCIQGLQDADGFCFVSNMGCQLSWESVCFARRRSQVRSLYIPQNSKCYSLIILQSERKQALLSLTCGYRITVSIFVFQTNGASSILAIHLQINMAVWRNGQRTRLSLWG